MGILVNKNTRVITPWIAGATGLFHGQGALDNGTQMIGGATPGKGGAVLDMVKVKKYMEGKTA